MLEVKKEIQERKISDIIFREDIYARFNEDNTLIGRYVENIESIIENNSALIEISKDNILIDGYHRLKAFERVYGKDKTINCLVHDTDNTDYIEIKSYGANNKHGKANSKQETYRNIQRLYAKGHSQDDIMRELSVSKTIFFDATKKQREDEKEERERKTIEMYLRAWNTQEIIANALGITQKTISNIVEDFSKNSAYGQFTKTFEPFLYNIWNTPKQDNQVKHFGAFPEIFMENLLHYHTEPLDIIFDPFGGGGTTVDVCKRMFRRYYVSDIKVIPGREKDIREHDIKNGIPTDLQKPKLVFLDPPYWKQAEKMYSESPNDLGNMSLDDFNQTMQNLLKEITQRKVERIAIVIQPTQYKNEFNWTDHIFDFHGMLKDKYKIEMRYILPYSTEQYLPQMVIKAKELNKCLCLNRDLLVWRLL